MNNYEILNRLGGGSFADVYKAIEKKNRRISSNKNTKKKIFKLGRMFRIT